MNAVPLRTAFPSRTHENRTSLAAQVITRVLTGRTLDSSLRQAWSRARIARKAGADPELCYGTLRHLSCARWCVRC
jgi:hypothetical protein